MSKNKREYILTNTRAFKDAERNNARFQDASQSLESAILSFGVAFTSKELLKMKDIKQSVTKVIFLRETKDATQPKGVNMSKYLDLLDINLNSLDASIKAFNDLSAYAKEVKEDDFKVWATTVADIKRVLFLKTTRDALNVMLEKGVFHNVHQLNISTGSMFRITDTAPHRLELKDLERARG
tara:strand:- start:257 stop:802 length:546 start_codon:yes stop_codon:yes gene_type:complete